MEEGAMEGGVMEGGTGVHGEGLGYATLKCRESKHSTPLECK